jgi:hypothetical protein
MKGYSHLRRVNNPRDPIPLRYINHNIRQYRLARQAALNRRRHGAGYLGYRCVVVLVGALGLVVLLLIAVVFFCNHLEKSRRRYQKVAVVRFREVGVRASIHQDFARSGYVFEGALVSASSLGLASFFGSIISHFRSYQIQQHQCSHHHLSSLCRWGSAPHNSIDGMYGFYSRFAARYTPSRPEWANRVCSRVRVREMSRYYCGGFKANRKFYAADPEYRCGGMP